MKDSLVHYDANIIEIIEAINATPIGIAFLTGNDGEFHSVFTDGDLRRLMLKEK